MTDISFVGPEYSGAEIELGLLADKLVTLANDAAVAKFGKDALLNPSDIQILPVLIDEPVYVVNAWHETGTANARGKMQVHDFSFRAALAGEDAYLITEDNRAYQLTTRETIFLNDLGNIAVMRSLLSESSE